MPTSKNTIAKVGYELELIIGDQGLKSVGKTFTIIVYIYFVNIDFL